eukprot:362326-Chlamydomonas_euryale.AAC.6
MLGASLHRAGKEQGHEPGGRRAKRLPDSRGRGKRLHEPGGRKKRLHEPGRGVSDCMSLAEGKATA